ncbi:dynein light chain 1, axonemal-like [Teleopsis dalmanni]|uniref:dynein light chain 1, axonemal-like n=1 Tax=Teleopsis dalmanni TaxID=139649 RepID=UPI0018CFD151|nr:dynein light chain 1, axonemal-like [Teleopsis dalmanni]
MIKPSTIKDAIVIWQVKYDRPASQSHEVNLRFQWPPIEDMNSGLTELKEVRRLSLANNMIEHITSLCALRKLKVLILSHNKIRKLNGIEVLANTLTQLWINQNYIEDLKPIECMKKLKLLYIAYNNIKDWEEFDRLALLPLEALSFVGNPLQELLSEDAFTAEVKKRLPTLKYLEGDSLKWPSVCIERH